MGASEQKQRLLSRWEVAFLIIAILIILYLIMQKFGISVMEVTDETKVMEKTHGGR